MTARYTAKPVPRQYDPGHLQQELRAIQQAIPWSGTVRRFNALDYGTYSGLARDFSGAVQKAANAAEAAGGGIVELPSMFRLDTAVAFGGGVTFEGAGWNTSTGETGSVLKLAHAGYAFQGKASLRGAQNITGVQFRHLKILVDTVNYAAGGGIDLESCTGAVVENVFVGPQDGTTVGTGKAFRLASNGAYGGLYNTLRNVVASKMGYGIHFENTTNQNQIYEPRCHGCTTGLSVAGNHNMIYNPDLETIGTVGIITEAASSENIFIGVNCDGGTQGVLDAGTKNYWLGVHEAGGLSVASVYGDGALVLNTTGTSQVPGDLQLANGVGLLYAQLLGPTNRQLRILSKGNDAANDGIKFFTRNAANSADVARLHIPDAGDQVAPVWSDANPAYGQVSPTYGLTVTINASAGTHHQIAVTNGAAFTIANPTNPVNGQELVVIVYNNSGGAMGAITWGSEFRLAGGAFTNPANGARRNVHFIRFGSQWMEVARTAADVT